MLKGQEGTVLMQSEWWPHKKEDSHPHAEKRQHQGTMGKKTSVSPDVSSDTNHGSTLNLDSGFPELCYDSVE